MTTTEDEDRIAVATPASSPAAIDRGIDGAIEPGSDSSSGRGGQGSWFAARWADSRSRRVIIGWAVLIASLVVYYFVAGIPWSTNSVLLYVMAGLVVSSLGSGVRWKRLLLDWLPLVVVLFGYGILRGYASHTLWGPFYRPQVWFDTHVSAWASIPPSSCSAGCTDQGCISGITWCGPVT